MIDFLQIYGVEEVNISHINNLNSDGHSTIFSFKKKDGTTTQVTAYGHKQGIKKYKIRHTRGHKDEDIFQYEIETLMNFIKQVFAHFDAMRNHNEQEEALFEQANQILKENDDVLNDGGNE